MRHPDHWLWFPLRTFPSDDDRSPPPRRQDSLRTRQKARRSNAMDINIAFTPGQGRVGTTRPFFPWRRALGSPKNHDPRRPSTFSCRQTYVHRALDRSVWTSSRYLSTEEEALCQRGANASHSSICKRVHPSVLCIFLPPAGWAGMMDRTDGREVRGIMGEQLDLGVGVDT